MKKIIFVLLLVSLNLSAQTTNIISKSNPSSIIAANSTSAINFATTNDLRVFESPIANTLMLLTAKGKEGFFYYEETDKTTADNEGTVIVSKRGKRYKRVFEGEVVVTWFGAKGDGKTDDSMAFLQAITSGTNSVYVPYKEAGYKISNVAVTKSITIHGDNKFNSKIFPASENSSCFITENEFVEYRDLYFDGAGRQNVIGIRHKHRISTVFNCFFSGFYQGIYNDKVFISGGKPDEQLISSCRFRDCKYGVFSDGNFINSKIIHSIFHGCSKSAIFCVDDSYDAAINTTEGLVIEDDLIYACGNSDSKTAAVELRNIDFSYIRNCMIDINNFTAFNLTNAQNCRISNTYFSSASGKNASTVKLIGNCSNTIFDGCQFYDSKLWGVEIIGTENRVSSDIRFTNCSARLNGSGDLLLIGGTNIWVSNCNFYSGTNALQCKTYQGNTTVFVRNSTLLGSINKEGSAIIDIKDCPGLITNKVGSIKIAAGENIVLFPHGLFILPGQKVFVFVSNATNSETVSAAVIDKNIKIVRAGTGVPIDVTYKAEVF